MASPSARLPSPCSPSASPLYHDDDSSSSSTRSSCSTSSCSSVTSQPLCEPDVVYLPPSFTHASSSPSFDKTNVTAGHMDIERALQKGNHGHVFLAHWQLPCNTTSKFTASNMKRPRCTTSHSREYGGEEEDGAGRRSSSPCAAVQESVDETHSTRRRRLEGSEGCDGTGAAFVCYDEVRDGVSTPPRNMNSDCSSEKCGSLRLALKIVSARSAHVTREVACLRYLQQQHYAECVHTPFDKSVSESSVGTDALPCPRLYFALPESSQAMALMTPSAGLRRALHRLRRRQPYFIAVELLGPDLFDFTGRYWLTEQELCLVATHMLSTLRAVHRAGVVHRSVKPENFCWALPTRSSSSSEEETATTALRLKLIDYGRSTFPSSSSTRTQVSHAECDVERPYTGWWHSLHGFIGRRLGPKDDLMGIVHTVGYLLDDFRRDTTRSSDKHTHHHRSEYDGKHYAACRRVLSDRILDAYAAFYADEEQSHTITECNTFDSDSESESDVSSQYFARAIERPSAPALAYMESRVLPRLLPDTYYPAHLPAWWKAWYGECGAMHAATSVTPEQMAQRMHHVLMQRVSGRGGEEGLDAVQEDVAWLVQRYLAKHATSPSPR